MRTIGVFVVLAVVSIIAIVAIVALGVSSPLQKVTATFAADAMGSPPVDSTPLDVSTPPAAGTVSTPLPEPPVPNPKGCQLGQTVQSPVDGMVMVCVPAGEFMMGSNRNSDEQPVHPVYLDSYWVDITEVTRGQFQMFMDTTGYVATPHGTADSYPVTFIKWEDARAYCEWVGRRLPTEAEWEKAARGTDARAYPWGEKISCDYTNANYPGCPGEALPVGSKPAGASPYGALDMSGNVAEWVADWYNQNYYEISPKTNPQGPERGEKRVFRGGSWDNTESKLTTTYRAKESPGGRDAHVGFRCVMDTAP